MNTQKTIELMQELVNEIRSTEPGRHLERLHEITYAACRKLERHLGSNRQPAELYEICIFTTS